MVPSTILHQLARLRGRERLLRFTWGAARWVAVVLLVLAAACAIDWCIDRFTETPWPVRYVLSAAQVLLAVLVMVAWVFGPALKRLSDNRLALWVEDKHPRLNHRLISTVQLNRRGAKIEGMSKELIAGVTRETEQQAKGMNFAGVADHRRLKWSAGVVGPVVLAAAGLFVLMPEIVQVLLERQLLMDRDIPRRYHLESVEVAAVRPAGEEVTLKFLVSGPDLGPDLPGSTVIFLEGQGSERFQLDFDSHSEKHPGKAYYTARVPAVTADFAYRGYLGDGRTSNAAYVRFEPRPVITKQDAWVLMRFSKRGASKQFTVYEQEQARGDIVSLPNQEARVRITVQKPIKSAKLELLGSAFPDLSRPFGDSETQAKGVRGLLDRVQSLLELTRDGRGTYGLASILTNALLAVARHEHVLRTIEASPNSDGTQAEFLFQVRPTETAYRITVLDEYGFANVPRPVRTIRVVPEEAPQVALLPEIIRDPSDKGNDEDFDQTGMPAPPGQPVQVAYTCTGPLSLGRATLYFRVIKKPKEESGETPPPGEDEWQPLHLIEAPGSFAKGAFDLRYGAFQKSGMHEDVGFHVIAASDDRPGKTEGGGRYNFQTSKLTFKSRGQQYVGQELEPGDKIEFYVQVYPDGKFDGKTDVAAKRLPGRSEVRGKEIVSVKDWLEARERRQQQEDRLKELRKQQEKVTPGVTTSFLHRQALPTVGQRAVKIYQRDTVIVARHTVGWEPSRWGSYSRQHYKGGVSC